MYLSRQILIISAEQGNFSRLTLFQKKVSQNRSNCSRTSSYSNVHSIKIVTKCKIIRMFLVLQLSRLIGIFSTISQWIRLKYFVLSAFSIVFSASEKSTNQLCKYSTCLLLVGNLWSLICLRSLINILIHFFFIRILLKCFNF